MKFQYSQSIATLVGTVIGAGILGIPYAVAQVGVWPGMILLLILGLTALVLNLMFGEVVLRTRERHQVAGYAKKYLGVWAYRTEVLAMMIGSFGALVAYIIGQGEVLGALLGGDKFVLGLIFFAVGAIILFFGLEIIKVFELWMVFVFLVLVGVILGISGASASLANMQYVNLGKLFAPYGVILFAYGGVAAVVPLREILRRQEKKVKSAIMWGTLIPMIVYGLFTIIVVGVTGLKTTEVATVGLGQVIGPNMIVFGNLFAFFAMGTSFLTIGLVLKQFFQYDLKMSKHLSWLAVTTVPLIIFLISSKEFITTLGIVGSLAFGLTGIIIVFTFWKAKTKGDRGQEYNLPKLRVLGSLMIFMFVLGIIYTLWNVFV
jgi:tyrosine-specific transport protein